MSAGVTVWIPSSFQRFLPVKYVTGWVLIIRHFDSSEGSSMLTTHCMDLLLCLAKARPLRLSPNRCAHGVSHTMGWIVSDSRQLEHVLSRSRCNRWMCVFPSRRYPASKNARQSYHHYTSSKHALVARRLCTPLSSVSRCVIFSYDKDT